MALFKKNPKGGIVDVIRCDETDFLIWKWHPKGSVEGETERENGIRWGSSLRVKNGEAAVFRCHSEGKLVQQTINGPYDSILETENLPIIAAAVSSVYNGDAPFPAEVYFVNLAHNLQIKIGVPYFDVADPRFPDRGVPTSVRGVINFKITDTTEFIEKHQLRTLSLEEFKGKVKAPTIKYVKNAVVNAPEQYGIPVTQLEKRLLDINEIIEGYLKNRLLDQFGVTVTSVDISDIEIEKNNPNYKFLIKKSDVDINLGVATNIRSFVADTTNEAVGVAIGAAAQVAELATDTATAAVDVKEYQYAKHKKSQIGFVKGLFKGGGDLSAAEQKPKFGSKVSKGVSSIASDRALKKEEKDAEQVPPPIPSVNYHVAVGNNAEGPFDLAGLKELFDQGKLTPESLVWKKGMEDWAAAGTIEELIPLFDREDGLTPPPIPNNQ